MGNDDNKVDGQISRRKKRRYYLKIVRISLSSLFSDYSQGFPNLVASISFTFDLSAYGDSRRNESNT